MPSQEHDAIVELLSDGGAFSSDGGALDVPRLRKEMEFMAEMSVMPERSLAEPVAAAPVPAEWLYTPDSDESRALLYLHGGGDRPQYERAALGPRMRFRPRILQL